MPGRGADLPETQTQPRQGGTVIITNVSQPTMALFKVPHASGPVPAVIVCPGGGYGILAYNLEGTETIPWLHSMGITAVVLKYRVPKNRDGAYEDLQRTVRLVRLHAAEWGILPGKVGVLGFSAGGNLAARLSTNFAQSAYPAIDPADQLSCRPDFAMLLYPAYLSLNKQLAPDLPVTSAVPPTLIIHAENDPGYLVGSKLYDAALTAANVPHEFLLYHTGGHGFGMRPYTHSHSTAFATMDVRIWPDQAAEWLRKIGIL